MFTLTQCRLSDAFTTFHSGLILSLCGRRGRERLLTYVGKFRDIEQLVAEILELEHGCIGKRVQAKQLLLRPMSWLQYHRSWWVACVTVQRQVVYGWQTSDMLIMASTCASASGRGENLSKEVFSYDLQTSLRHVAHGWSFLPCRWKGCRKYSLQHAGGRMSIQDLEPPEKSVRG